MRHPNRNAMSIAADTSGVLAGSLAFGFLALMYGTFVGFELTQKTEARNETEFDYLESVSTLVLSSFTVPSADANWHNISAVGVRKRIDDSSDAMRETNATGHPPYPPILVLKR